MHNPVAIGAMIQRNRAALAKRDDQLAALVSLMPLVDRDLRRMLGRLALRVERARLGLRLIGWLLSFLGPR
jgi:hypothetical protein